MPYHGHFVSAVYTTLSPGGGRVGSILQTMFKEEKTATSTGVFFFLFFGILSSPFLVFWAVLGWTRPPIVEVE